MSGKNLVQKIIAAHLVKGRAQVGEEIGIRIDQTLTQDATGTMAYLQFEALGLPRVKTELSASYVDHNTLQTGFQNADDHRFLQLVAARYGIYFSKPGNGICHQVHLERFGVPGKTILGSDSHTPTAGGLAMLAIGAGGLEVACAMGGAPFYFKMPKVVLVRLKGKLPPWVNVHDAILELLRRLTVRGGVGKIFEYGGDGIKSLSVPERATLTNMGAELGATSSVFPSDDITKRFLRSFKRVKDWKPLSADRDAKYDETIELDLSKLKPLVACPHSPDNVKPIDDSSLKGKKVDQVIVGSCTHSSYRDLMTVAKALKGKRVHPQVSFCIAPGSQTVLEAIAANGALTDIVRAGARILETACGPCIGMGQSPPTNGISVRTINRNFFGRSGTPSAGVYLASPEVACACALKGTFADPRKLGKPISVKMPKQFSIDDSLLITPPKSGKGVRIERGPNIKPFPKSSPLPKSLSFKVVLKVGDNISTDHILPGGSKILPLRSNIPAIAEHVFIMEDPDFVRHTRDALSEGGSAVLGGINYGQGSSREHAALAPMYLGVRCILAKSFSRIHRANLINFGILPLVFENEVDYDVLKKGDLLTIDNVHSQLREGKVRIKNVTQSKFFIASSDLTKRERAILLEGGLLNYTRREMLRCG